VKLSLSNKLILLFLAMALIPTLVVGVLSYANTYDALSKQIHTQINNTASRQVIEVNKLVDADYEDLNLFADRQQVRSLLQTYSQQPTLQNQRTLSAALTTAQQDNETFRRIHVLDTHGKIVGSSDSRFIGKDYSNTEIYKLGSKQADVSIFFKDIDGRLSQYLTTPLTLPYSSTKIGTVILEAETDSYNLIAQNYADVGKTGETLLTYKAGNQQYYLLPLRFNENAALQPVKATTTGNKTIDYRGHAVVAVSREIPRTDWTLQVKIDEAEVYASVLHMRNITVLIILLTIALTIPIGWFFARIIIRPIRRLTTAAEKIRAGNTSLRVRVESSDEIGTLSAAFNDMTTSLVDSQARLSSSILSLPFGLAVIDSHNRIILSNKLFSKLVGHAIPADPSKTPEVLKRINADFNPAIDILKSIKRAQDKTTSIEKNIEYGPLFFRLFFSPIITDAQRVIGTVMIIEDTTERAALDRSRDEFFSIASHELRTPLSAIRGNSDMALQFYSKQLKDPDLHQMVVDIHEASLRLISIVNDFLDISRLEQEKAIFNVTTFNLTDLVQQILREYDVTGSRKKLALELTPKSKPIMVAADADRTRQVIISLLSNAVRFTKEGGVKIQLTVTKDRVKMTMTDTGSGIPVEAQHLLFRKLQQASASILTRDDTQSTGLGLYTSKLIVEGMGGKIYLEKSEVNVGSTFAVELPRTVNIRLR